MTAFRYLSALLSVFWLASCTSAPKVHPEMSEQMRQMAEMRDTCTQYAAWAARSLPAESADLRRVQMLYIEASAAANSYLEALQFDVAVGNATDPKTYEEVAQRVHDSSDVFLKEARKALGIPQTRGLPLLIIPLVSSLLDLSEKIHGSMNARDKEGRELVVKALADKKWKPFNELSH